MPHEEYMRRALALAEEAFYRGEVPVGCVITDAGGKIIGEGSNRREEKKCALSHAELEAIAAACGFIGDWRLTGCTMYVTLEPCPMCAGAIINSRISTIVFGAKEENSGSCGSVINIFEERYGHKPAIFGGVLEAECRALMMNFFSGRR